MTSFIWIFGLIFQLPLIASLLKSWIVDISYVAVQMKVGHPDFFYNCGYGNTVGFFSMFAVALPTIILYEISILIACWIGKRNPLNRSLYFV